MKCRTIFHLLWIVVWLVFTGYGIGKNGDLLSYAVHVLVTIPCWVLVLWVLVKQARKGEL